MLTSGEPLHHETTAALPPCIAACAPWTYNGWPMRREDAIAALRGFMPVIRRDFGVRRIALFGSTARGGARDDIDILAEFETGPTFLSFMGLKVFLEDHLGRKVDLVTPDAVKPRLRPVVEREAVDVP